ncbi:AAA family ATPase [Anabaena sp. UHCC 0204]|uniref:AAA family ATPase n=1 Tax=Anabaena sp. UHCC 0204 TaxID=2590009 RepID=UPI0014478EF5|nr:AAA family ATPase [Anabaena sp. UHCC 0204]MTJ09157.1 AAA family ATPase [Anabaena sp. UHCC 0204]
MATKIAKVSIENFRGISTQLIMDFKSTFDDSPHSLILFGDNGTGKSSVVDAIQFALQKEIGKDRKITAIRSLFGKNKPSVQITLANGRVVNTKLQIQRERDEDFYIAPFVLRRADILRFLNTPDEKRQLIFFNYRFTSDDIKDEIRHSGMSDDQDLTLQEQRIANKNKRRKLAESLATRIQVATEIIPLGEKDFNNFAREKIYGGLTRKDRSNLQKGNVVHVDPITHSIVKQIRKINKELKIIEKRQKEIQDYEKRSARESIIKDLLINTEKRITESFQNISKCNFVNQIKLLCGDMTAVSLSIEIHLNNGIICSPHQIFSEANLDLLVLLVFLSLIKESAERGQSKVLILDNVLQSVDSTIRVSITDYILKEFSDWQLIITAHDRLWKSQLCDLFRRNSHQFIESEIIRWNYKDGPTVFNTSKDIDYLLLEAIDRGEAISICSQAGILLEELCNKLSWILPTSVIRKKEDKYTLGDLWPGISKILKKTNLKSAVEEVDKWLHLRNLVGAHYNEWARSVSTQEVQLFAEAVLQLFWHIRCNKCFRWIEPLGSQGKHWACRCKQLNVENK